MGDPFCGNPVRQLQRPGRFHPRIIRPQRFDALDIANAEPLWMADDARCLLKAGEGKYILWKPDGSAYPIVTNNFLPHRLTRNGVVVGTMAVTNSWTN